MTCNNTQNQYSRFLGKDTTVKLGRGLYVNINLTENKVINTGELGNIDEKAAGFEAVLAITILLTLYKTEKRRIK